MINTDHKMTRHTLKTMLLCCSLTIALLTGCKNPFNEEKTKVLIRDEVFYNPPMGRYVYYWNGLDNKGKTIKPGRYIVILEMKNFQDQDYVTALEGGKPGSAETGYRYYNEIWTKNELGLIEPNPFHINAGCAITFILNGSGTTTLSIYRE